MRRPMLIVLVATMVSAATLLAEKRPMSKVELKSTATHIIVGPVAAIYQRTEAAGDWKYTKYVAEVRANDVEKGDGIKKGDLVYVRYWQRQWVGHGQQPPSTIGHRGLPAVNDVMRIYVAKNAYDGFDAGNTDGGFNVIGADGFEKVGQ